MVNLYENLGKSTDSPLETAGVGFDTASVSLEPGHGTVKRGTVLYRKSGALYAPAAAANIDSANQLAVLREDVNTDESATVAALGDVIVAGGLLAEYVLLADGSKLTAAQALILRQQGIVLKPYDALDGSAPVADNTATVSVTVTNDGHGTGSASPASGTKGTEVTLTATPGEGYELDAWEVVSGGVEIVDDKFTIGDEAVTVKATFKATT